MATNCAVLLGYGVFGLDKKRLPQYRGYLDRFVGFAKAHRIGDVVVCSGYSSPKVHISEAASIAAYLKPRLPGVRMRKEERSLSTPENISYARRYLDFDSADRIYVYCDHIRFNKVMWFVLHYWFGLRRRQIMDYFSDTFAGYFRRMPIDEMARAINRDGYSYMKVSVIPDAKLNDETALATHQQISSILETMVLYDKKMGKKGDKIIRLRHGFKR
jgi:hypothetical protein